MKKRRGRSKNRTRSKTLTTKQPRENAIDVICKIQIFCCRIPRCITCCASKSHVLRSIVQRSQDGVRRSAFTYMQPHVSPVMSVFDLKSRSVFSHPLTSEPSRAEPNKRGNFFSVFRRDETGGMKLNNVFYRGEAQSNLIFIISK